MLTLRAKLIFMVAAISLMMLVVGMLGLWGIRSANSSLDQLYSENLVTTEEFSRIVALMRESRVQLLLALMHDREVKWSRMHDHPVAMHTDLVRKNLEEVRSTWKRYGSIPKSAEEAKMAERFETICNEVINRGMLPAVAAIQKGRFDEAARLSIVVMNGSYARAAEAMSALVKHEANQANSAYDAAEARYARIRNTIIVVLVLALLLGGYSGLVIVRTIGSATQSLVEASSRLADGDLTARVSLLESEEMVRMGDSFNRIGESFHTLIGDMKGNMEHLAVAAEQLLQTSGEMANGSENVATQIGAIATASEEMAATSTEIAHNCLTVAENSRQANDAALNGARVVQASVEIMNSIAERVRETARTVEGLGSRSDQIGEIVGTIEDIADQTNLLALNAAIEAARAGEQGRGFAVVADEVRALAERTAKATREIGEMIRSIQDETRAVVTSMDDGVREVEKGTCEAARSGSALQEIIDQINNLNVRVNEIATAAEEQTATTNEISSNILQISEVVSEAARGAQDSASAANQLATIATEMESIVGRFRLAG